MGEFPEGRSKIMLDIDVIFFDVDGTLVDARIDIVKSVNYTLQHLGASQRPFDEIVSYIGTGIKDLVAKSLHSDDEDLILKGVDILGEYYSAHSVDESRLYPHVEEILKYFRNKRKYILTNRYSRFAEVTLRGLGIREYFDRVIGGDDENCLKPSPCILSKTISELKINRRRAIIVGDMAIDVETGKNSGIKTCWVTYGLGKLEDVKHLKPDYIIEDIIELEEIIKL